MTSRLSVVHTTTYRYDAPVTSSYNEARLEPRSDQRQVVLSWQLDVRPSARVERHVDYWGTVVHHFDLQVPHKELTIVGRAMVETGLSTTKPGTASWAELDDDATRDQFHEVLSLTSAVDVDDEIVGIAEKLRAEARTPAEGAEAAVAWVNERLAYEPGTTHVASKATEVLAGGSGVCQDFAHVSLAVLRLMGIPAWYVSGYLHPHLDPEVGETVVGESHAWVATWTGAVWRLDPTSLTTVRDRHVRVATGRDYNDVQPFRGIYAGGGEGQELDVQVEVTRMT